MFWIQPSLIIVVIIVILLLYSSFLLYHIFKTNPKQVYTNILILSLLCFLLHLLNACSLIFTYLASINDKFLPSMQDKKSQAEFIVEIQRIDTGLESTLKLKEEKKIVIVSENEASQSKYQSFVDEQRAYFKAVKDFQMECDRNEVLTEKLENR